MVHIPDGSLMAFPINFTAGINLSKQSELRHSFRLSLPLIHHPRMFFKIRIQNFFSFFPVENFQFSLLLIDVCLGTMTPKFDFVHISQS